MQKKRIVIAVATLCILAVAVLAAYLVLGVSPTEGEKLIYVEIINPGGGSATKEIRTDALYLREALEEQNLIQGDETEFGLFVKTVDGVTADDRKNEWWCFTKGGEQLMTGVDTTPIEDGDHFEVELQTYES